jgi:hypothetical protein
MKRTYLEYINALNNSIKDENLRAGQHAMGLLYTYNQTLYQKITGSDIDPFYLDNKLGAFFSYIQEHWND